MAEADDHRDAAAFLCGGGEAGDLIAQVDWAATSLGPLSGWPQSLRTATAIVLRSPRPMVLAWGAEGVIIHNDAYARLTRGGYPKIIGTTAREAWPKYDELVEEAVRAGQRIQPLVYRDLELTSFRSGQPEQIWMDIDCLPVPDESGRPAGLLAICAETTERVLAQRQRALEFERLGRMFEQAPGFICLLRGPELRVELVNEAHRRLFGERHAEGRLYVDAFADVAMPEVLDRVYQTGERYVTRGEAVQISRLGGTPEEHLLDVVVEPISDDDRQVVGIFVEGFDVTEQVRAQAAAEESERRLSAAVSIARLGAFEWDLETGKATLDDRAREIFGFGPDEALTINQVVERIDSRDAERVRAESAAFETAHRTRREFEYRIHTPDGSTREIAAVSDAVAGPDGRATRIVGIVDDVTEVRAAEKRQRMLINELNHRVKNTLATVQSIAAQTLRSAPDLLSARDSFEARLVALAMAHDLLTAQSWRGASLADVAAAAMAPFETVQRPQISRAGPPVWLTAQSALALSLALHELATNAAKYGALSVPGGQVSIRWSLEGAELTLCWREDGGPPVKAPTRSGFGARLLQRSLAHELHGDVTVNFAPEGVRCEIRCRVEGAQPEAVGGGA